MSFLTGLHGSIATLLLCLLLFIDEAGIPLPFAPSEVLLIMAGLLIASGALSPLVFFPIAFLAMIGGSFLGYSWAKAIGTNQIGNLAEKLRARRTYERATKRINQADAH
jgi:membrane protein DedA with SNARE-associated domain